MVFSDNFKLL